MRALTRHDLRCCLDRARAPMRHHGHDDLRGERRARRAARRALPNGPIRRPTSEVRLPGSTTRTGRVRLQPQPLGKRVRVERVRSSRAARSAGGRHRCRAARRARSCACRLERQQRQHVIDIGAHLARPARPPRPHAGRDIVDDGDLRRALADALGDRMRELRASMMTTASGSAAMAASAVRRTRAMMRGSRGRIDNGPITATSLKGNCETSPSRSIPRRRRRGSGCGRLRGALSAAMSVTPSASPECSPAIRNRRRSWRCGAGIAPFSPAACRHARERLSLAAMLPIRCSRERHVREAEAIGLGNRSVRGGRRLADERQSRKTRSRRGIDAGSGCRSEACPSTAHARAARPPASPLAHAVAALREQRRHAFGCTRPPARGRDRRWLRAPVPKGSEASPAARPLWRRRRSATASSLRGRSAPLRAILGPPPRPAALLAVASSHPCTNSTAVVGAAHELGPLEQARRPPHRDAGKPGRHRTLDRTGADRGQSMRSSWPRLGSFGEHAAPLRRRSRCGRAAPPRAQHGVGAFRALDRQHRPVGHDDGLADVERPQRGARHRSPRAASARPAAAVATTAQCGPRRRAGRAPPRAAPRPRSPCPRRSARRCVSTASSPPRQQAHDLRQAAEEARDRAGCATGRAASPRRRSRAVGAALLAAPRTMRPIWRQFDPGVREVGDGRVAPRRRCRRCARRRRARSRSRPSQRQPTRRPPGCRCAS